MDSRVVTIANSHSLANYKLQTTNYGEQEYSENTVKTVKNIKLNENL